MKNVFLTIVLLAISFASVNGSVRIKPYAPDPYSWEEHEAANLWQRSAPLNRVLLEMNHGYIYPGDWLLLAYPQKGDSLWAPVQKGDYPLKVSERVIVEQPHKENYPEDADNNVGVKSDNNEGSSALAKFWQNLKNLPLWNYLNGLSTLGKMLLLYLLAIIVGIIYFIIQRKNKAAKQKEWAKDPVKSGTPFRENGLPVTEAHQRVAEIIAARYPGSTYVIKSIRLGTLNGQAIVWYKGEETPKERVFDNVEGYEALVEINGHEEKVYTLQGCGNPIMEGDFFKAGHDFTFTPHLEVAEDGTTTAIPQPQNETMVEPKKEIEINRTDHSRTVADISFFNK